MINQNCMIMPFGETTLFIGDSYEDCLNYIFFTYFKNATIINLEEIYADDNTGAFYVVEHHDISKCDLFKDDYLHNLKLRNHHKLERDPKNNLRIQDIRSRLTVIDEEFLTNLINNRSYKNVPLSTIHLTFIHNYNIYQYSVYLDCKIFDSNKLIKDDIELFTKESRTYSCWDDGEKEKYYYDSNKKAVRLYHVMSM